VKYSGGRYTPNAILYCDSPYSLTSVLSSTGEGGYSSHFVHLDITILQVQEAMG